MVHGRRMGLFVAMTAVLGAACGQAGTVAAPSNASCSGAAPEYRDLAFSFYDREAQMVMIYGGYSRHWSPTQFDMWGWNGRCWVHVRPADGQLPGPRSRGFTAYDPDHHRILLFGGQGQDAPALRQLWSWAGTRWTRLPDAPIAATTFDGAMAYDPARHQLVVVVTNVPMELAGTPSSMVTWLFDGAKWEQSTPAHEIPYQQGYPVAGAAFDFSNRQVLVARTGAGPTEVWGWDGRDWKLTNQNLPTAGVRDLLEAGDFGILAPDGGNPLSPDGQPRPVYQLRAGRWITAGSPSVGPAMVIAPAYDEHRKELVTFTDIAMPNPSAEQVYTADTWTWTLAGGWTKHPGPAPTPSPSPSPTATASPSQTPGPTPPAFPAPGPGAAALQCRLPVTFSTGYFPDSLAYNAFVQLPEGRVTSVQKFLYGSPKFGTYLESVNQWVPFENGFEPRWVAILPDESGYVSMETDQQPPYTTRLHLVDSANRGERLVQVPPPDEAPHYIYLLRGYAPEGVYVSQAASATEDGGHGLWLLDPNTGTRREITPFGYWPITAGGGAWGYTNDDTVAPPPDGFAAFNSVVRLDLHTGQRQVWLVTPGRRIDIAGVDSGGRLLVMVSNGSSVMGGTPASVAELRLLSAPAQWRTFPVPSATTHDGLANTYFTGLADANGIWVSDMDAIYLFDPQRGVQLVVVGGHALNPAGRCT